MAWRGSGRLLHDRGLILPIAITRLPTEDLSLQQQFCQLNGVESGAFAEVVS